MSGERNYYFRLGHPHVGDFGVKRGKRENFPPSLLRKTRGGRLASVTTACACDRTQVPRPQLSAAKIAEVRAKNMENFRLRKLKETGVDEDGRCEFIPALVFRGRRRGYYWGRGGGGLEKKEGKRATRIHTADGVSRRSKSKFVYISRARISNDTFVLVYRRRSGFVHGVLHRLQADAVPHDARRGRPLRGALQEGAQLLQRRHLQRPRRRLHLRHPATRQAASSLKKEEKVCAWPLGGGGSTRGPWVRALWFETRPLPRERPSQRDIAVFLKRESVSLGKRSSQSTSNDRPRFAILVGFSRVVETGVEAL